MGRLMDRFRQATSQTENNNPQPALQRQTVKSSSLEASWEKFSQVTQELWGKSPTAHAILDIVRLVPGNPSGSSPVTRIFYPNGDFLGIVSEDYWQKRGVGLGADMAGQFMLANKLPEEKIEIKYKTLEGLTHYPYSGIEAVIVVKGIRDLVRAAAWVLMPGQFKQFGSGIPVIAYIDGGQYELAKVKWPKYASIYVKDEKIIQEISSSINKTPIKLIGR
jgi:hypothetical protein